MDAKRPFGSGIPPIQGWGWVLLRVTLGDAQGCIIAAPLGLAAESKQPSWHSGAGVQRHRRFVNPAQRSALDFCQRKYFLPSLERTA